jgi:thymidylate synthase
MQPSSFESVDAVQAWALRTLLERGSEAQPRGLRILELYPAHFELRNPRNRLVVNPRRKWNFALALGEFAWHVSGSNDLEFIEYYAPRWKEFTDNQTVTGSCYGYRVFSREGAGTNQWERIIEILRTDPESRRAVLLFQEPPNLIERDAKDVPCATSLQFLIRGNRLHAFTHMRSNDAIWGMPYDIFLFTMFQELMALELNVELGTYSHFATSLHLYERHFALAREVIAEDASVIGMPPMDGYDQLSAFLMVEQQIRKGRALSDMTEAKKLTPYWYLLLQVLDNYRASKASEIQEGDYLSQYCLAVNSRYYSGEFIQQPSEVKTEESSRFFQRAS